VPCPVLEGSTPSGEVFVAGDQEGKTVVN
jgi:hypothetical protein